MLAIRIINPDTGLFIDTYGLIDTGADDCAIPASLAESLGHNLKAGKIKKIATGNGLTNAYTHLCTIQIFDTMELERGNLKVVYSVPDTPFDFLPRLNCILLGTKSFMSKFILTIDYPGKTFSLRATRSRR
jgi:hypothetical protein